MVRVADYIAKTLADYGVRHVFMVTGGGAMHLNDAIGRCKGLRYICCHHEQACAMAAESYYRLTNRLALVNVTSGPGATNAITGVYGAWVDSIGMIVVSGQVKWNTCIASTPLHLRQLGFQEADIISMVKPITKYAVLVNDPMSIRYHLEKSLHLATTGRPGPCWIDVPLDIQGTLVNPEELTGYDPAEDPPPGITGSALEEACTHLVEHLRASRRPVLYAGMGIRLAGAYDRFLRLVDRWGIPVVTPWNSHDLLWDDHSCYAGRPGIMGERAGNFVVQNADFLLSMGCRLSIWQVGYTWETWARAAYKVMVDIDDQELKKPTLKIDLPIHADVGAVIGILERMDFRASEEQKQWLAWCQERRSRYPVIQESYWEHSASVNPYCFMEALFAQLPENQIIVTGNGSACVVTMHAAYLKRGQRLYHNVGSAPMGFDLPGAIGAAIASGGQRIICLTGEGGIQMNLQELQTIVEHHLPIKIFLLNNRGYHSIRQTQQAYFPDNPVGYDPDSGVSFPAFEKLAYAYGIPYQRCATHADLANTIEISLSGDGPHLCEVVVDDKQQFTPKISSKRLPDGRMVSPPLEDMAPFLDRDELRSNMLIPLVSD